MSQEKKYILALDHGTSGMKTAVISTKGDIVGFDVEEYGLYHYEQGCAEQKPQDWWNAVETTVHHLIDKNLVPVEDIIAVVSSNQMSGTVPIAKDGETLYNCLTWMDTRGAPMVEKMIRGLIKVSGYGLRHLAAWLPKTAGIPALSGKDCLAHMLWFKQKKPELYAKTWKFLDTKDYINFKLTGKTVSSYDMALLTWMLNTKDPNNIFLDPSLIRKTKIDRDKLPEVQAATYNLGSILPEIADSLGLSRNTQVILGAGDIASAGIGSGAVLDYQGHICVGSSSWVYTHISQRTLDIDHMITSLPCAIPSRYMFFGEQEAAGIILTWMRDNVLYHKDELLVEEQVPDVYKIFDRLVAEINPLDNSMIFTPWLFGERAPVEDHTIRGSLNNISLEVDRRHILRAIFEGVAYNAKWLLDAMEVKLKQRLDPLVFIGGGATSAVWSQIFADVLNHRVKRVKYPKESNSLGAAFIASVALGQMTWEEIPHIVQYAETYTPQKEYLDHYSTLFEEYKGLYKRNVKMYKRLNKFHE
ncbi:MAG: FGGY-family carbohydrate kinase [Candidatus Lokiarchaeota archaeon]|nr:FGGY-family carbohydrate kinase [Candidatus Lokiarchaeota archaeon]